MHLFFRTILVIWRARRRRRRGDTVAPTEVSRLRLRTLPTDIDLIGHMNNGVYLSIFDLGRYDQMIRAGLWEPIRARGWYPVVVSETVSFRRSLELWSVFDVETRIVGFDEKAAIVEQRVVVDGEIYTRALIRARFLSAGSGPVPIAELREAVGVGFDELPPLPDWVAEWAAAAALPGTKAPAPSTWP
ncbi:thioesterase [Mycetocola reblochoni]|uniref:Mesenchymal stem cell protein DSCD75 n=2 Tax=Mycetocola reblochoni TaxID=331618 RepID=A0A1R4IU84_9MICO|nr:thioesterase family protein [Mycetocola reblochoni]RLP71277.1 thioesterase [Mycetocola reblochoni]SJN22893.1 Mesenchymal stem cell protein DSCD75 [Mycetocola reblochoni REB411]